MKTIKKEEQINLKEIFGKKKYNKWIKKYPIMENKDVLSWLRDKIDKYTNKGKDASNFALTTYVSSLQRYCNFNETNNPTKLLEHDIDERNLRLSTYLKFLLNATEDDKDKLKDIGFSRGKPSEVSVRNMYQSRIKSFFSDRGKPISFGLKTAKSGENKNEVYLTKSMIKKIKNHLNPSYQLICKFQTQTGLRIGDVLKNLNSGKYNIERYKDHYFIKNFKTKKVGVTINYVFFTKELSTLIQSVHGIKDLTQLDTSKLMKTRNGTNILQNDYLQKIKEIAEDVGIKGNIKTHAFRKYFSSQVRKCKHVDDEFKEHLMGHVSYNLAQAYNNNLKDIAWYYNNWKKLETLVCVDCIVYDHTSKKVKNLEDKYNNIVKETTEKDKKISQLEEQNKKLMEKVSKMEKNIDKINEIMMKVTDSENAEIKRKAHEELGTKKTEKQIKKEAQINKESKEEYEETLEK